MPQPVRLQWHVATQSDERPRVVYLAACVSRAMGPICNDREQMPLIDIAPRTLKETVRYCEEGASTSRTCEIGPSRHSGLDYHALVYPVDRTSRAKARPA